MKPFTSSFAMGTGLVLLLTITPSWGQPTCQPPGCNPTLSDGFSNTAGGTEALDSLSTGLANTAFGRSALFSNTIGDNNTASGASALQFNTTGRYNTASGTGALQFNTTGNDNTASGTSALLLNTTGSDNTASGAGALARNNTGSQNTAVGAFALGVSTGDRNTAIGFNAGANLTTGNNNIYIGNNGASSEFQTIRIGRAQTSTFIAGINTATVGDATVMIDTATGQLGIATSSARYKQDIAPMGSRSDGVLQLRPVTFSYTDDARAITHYGLLAEQVATVYPELVTRTASGEVQTVKYQELIPMLLNELQKQRQDFQQALQSQQRELAELRALVGQGRGVANAGR